MNSYRIGVVGATGATGRTLLDIIHQRRFPASSVRLCASGRSLGKSLYLGEVEIPVEAPTPELFRKVDIVFLATASKVSHQLVPVAVDEGALVIDKSSAYRMDPNVPLVIPEVNSDDIKGHHRIIASPNCSTTPLAMILKPLGDVNAVNRVVVSTYQSVSGAGQDAMDELRIQSGQVLAGNNSTPEIFPHQIAFNTIPHIDSFLENGHTVEEMKMMQETRKILHKPNLAVSTTCVRIPTMISHSEAIHLEFLEPMSAGTVKEILEKSPGIKVMDDPNSFVYPMPINVEGRDEVFIGRIRQDESNPNGILLWVVSDNLRKGAALNAIQIAEDMIGRGLL